MNLENEDVLESSGLREGVRQSAQVLELIALQKIIAAVLEELVECGFSLPDCLHSVSSYLHKQGLRAASKLVENAAIELEEAD